MKVGARQHQAEAVWVRGEKLPGGKQRVTVIRLSDYISEVIWWLRSPLIPREKSTPDQSRHSSRTFRPNPKPQS